MEANQTVPTYNAALFDPIDPECFFQFQSRLIGMLKNDTGASLTRALLALHDSRRYKSERTEKKIQDYHQALIERFGYYNNPDLLGDPLLEALYHASEEFHYHREWAERRPCTRYYGPADHVWPTPRPLKTREQNTGAVSNNEKN
jgi:hypothetical protein